MTISIIFAYATCVDGEPRLPVVGDIPAGLPGFMYLGRTNGSPVSCLGLCVVNPPTNPMYLRNRGLIAGLVKGNRLRPAISGRATLDWPCFCMSLDVPKTKESPRCSLMIIEGGPIPVLSGGTCKTPISRVKFHPWDTHLFSAIYGGYKPYS